MQPNPRFSHQDKTFWANVRTIGQALGYTGGDQVRLYDFDDLKTAMVKSGLNVAHLVNSDGSPSPLALDLLAYFFYRAEILNTYVRPRLMDSQRAQQTYLELSAQLSPVLAAPFNKQKGEKRQIAYLTAIVNMIIEANLRGLPCDYNPKILTTITRDGAPLRTLARRRWMLSERYQSYRDLGNKGILLYDDIWQSYCGWRL